MSLDVSELPPRTRRIPPAVVVAMGQQGTTSACAENTRPGHRPHPGDGTTSACAENTRGDHEDRPYQRNYLRVRGEYQHTSY